MMAKFKSVHPFTSSNPHDTGLHFNSKRCLTQPRGGSIEPFDSSHVTGNGFFSGERNSRDFALFLIVMKSDARMECVKGGAGTRLNVKADSEK